MATISDENVIEFATFNIRPGMQQMFESALREVGEILGGQPGYIAHIAQRCHELNTRYTLLVEWRSVEDHMGRFLASPDARHCRQLTREYLVGSASAEHYRKI